MAVQFLYLLETAFPRLHRGEEEEKAMQRLQSWDQTLEKYIDGMDVHNPWPRTAVEEVHAANRVALTAGREARCRSTATDVPSTEATHGLEG